MKHMKRSEMLIVRFGVKISSFGIVYGAKRSRRVTLYLLGVKTKIPDELPPPFHMGVAPGDSRRYTLPRGTPGVIHL